MIFTQRLISMLMYQEGHYGAIERYEPVEVGYQNEQHPQYGVTRISDYEVPVCPHLHLGNRAVLP